MPQPPRFDFWRCWFPPATRKNVGLSWFPYPTCADVSVTRWRGLRGLFDRTHKAIRATRSCGVISHVERIACVWIKPRDGVSGRCTLNPSARFGFGFTRLSPVDLIVGIARDRRYVNHRAVIASRYRVAHLKSPQKRVDLPSQRTVTTIRNCKNQD